LLYICITATELYRHPLAAILSRKKKESVNLTSGSASINQLFICAHRLTQPHIGARPFT
jgi:hypothetical protein